MFRKLTAALIGLALLGFVSQAFAGPILTPDSFTVSSPDLFDPIDINFIDQSGLSSGYVSGVTDFDSFVASTTASNIGGFGVLGGSGPPPSIWQFDFGSVVIVDAIAIWNQFGSASLDTFTVETSLLADFSVSQVFGIFTMSIAGGANLIGADVFSFSSGSFQFLRVNTITNAGFEFAVRVNEIAFRQAAGLIPEPGSLALFAFGLAGLGFMMRRRRVI